MRSIMHPDVAASALYFFTKFATINVVQSLHATEAFVQVTHNSICFLPLITWLAAIAILYIVTN